MDFAQALADEFDELFIMPLARLQAHGSVALTRGPDGLLDNLLLRHGVALHGVIRLPDAAVAAVGRADVGEFNEAAVIDIGAHQLRRAAEGFILQHPAVFEVGEPEKLNDVFVRKSCLGKNPGKLCSVHYF